MNNQPQNITLILLTKNESQNISRYFSWIGECPNINEIVVVDDNSTDKTLKQISKSKKNYSHLTLKIFTKSLDNNFAQQRNFAVSKSANNWILWLDADETPSQEMVNFLKNFHPTHLAYSFKRLDIFLNHPLRYGETAKQNFTRLFDKNHGQFVQPVHEIWQTKKKVFPTSLSITHLSHPNLTGFLSKINFYSTIRAQELFSQDIKTNIIKMILYPTAKFFQNYFLKLGFLDSTPGIIIALGMSLHSFLVRTKLWKLWQK